MLYSSCPRDSVIGRDRDGVLIGSGSDMTSPVLWGQAPLTSWGDGEKKGPPRGRRGLADRVAGLQRKACDPLARSWVATGFCPGACLSGQQCCVSSTPGAPALLQGGQGCEVQPVPRAQLPWCRVSVPGAGGTLGISVWPPGPAQL